MSAAGGPVDEALARTTRTEAIRCLVCGATSQQPVAATIEPAEVELDFRPASLGPEELATLVQRCPTCNYCAYRLDAAIGPEGDLEIARRIVRDPAYLGVINDPADPTLARAFRCRSVLEEAGGALDAAAWSAIHAAWAADDAAAEASARRLRRAALDLYEASLSPQYEETIPPGNAALVRVDLLRRMGEPERADLIARLALMSARPFVRTCLLFERELISEDDEDRHTANEARTFQLTASPGRLRELAGDAYAFIAIDRGCGHEALVQLAAAGFSGASGAAALDRLIRSAAPGADEGTGQAVLDRPESPSVWIEVGRDGIPTALVASVPSTSRLLVEVGSLARDADSDVADLLTVEAVDPGYPLNLALANPSLRGMDVATGDRAAAAIVAMPIELEGVWANDSDRDQALAGSSSAMFAAESFIPMGTFLVPGVAAAAESSLAIMSARVLASRRIVNPETGLPVVIGSVRTAGGGLFDAVIPVDTLMPGQDLPPAGSVVGGVWSLVATHLELETAAEHERTLLVRPRQFMEPPPSGPTAGSTDVGTVTAVGPPAREDRTGRAYALSALFGGIAIVASMILGSDERPESTFRPPSIVIPSFGMPSFGRPSFGLPSFSFPSVNPPSFVPLSASPSGSPGEARLP